MFKNPIKKYQSGGKATPQQQQQIAQLFEAASKNTGIDVETLMNAANELKDENSMKQYVEAISLAAQGDKTAIDSIKKMFGQQPAMRKLGGKIRDFICKHANGKKIADCGCGNKVPKGEMGVVIRPTSYNRANGLQFVERQYTPDGQAVYTMATSRETLPSNMLADPYSEYSQNGGEYQGNGQVQIIDNGKGNLRVLGNPYSPTDEGLQHGQDSVNYVNRLRELAKKANIKLGPSFQENGGVVKGQNSIPGGMPEPTQVGIVYRKKYKPIGENQATYEDSEYVTTKNEPLLGKRYTGWWRQVEPGTTKLAYSDMFGGMPEGMTHRFTRINNGDNILDVIIPYNTDTDANELNTVQRLINGQDTTYFPDRAKFIDLLRSKRTFANGRPNWIVLDNERNKVNKK